jgi:hypothetical protein
VGSSCSAKRSLRCSIAASGNAAPEGLLVWCIALLLFPCAVKTIGQTSIPPESSLDNNYIGDRACQQCHSAIYESQLTI